MARKNRERRLGLNAEINVVSLIDVILLLLLIFMITAPMMMSGLNVTLPKADVERIQARNSVLVEVNRAGKIYVDGKEWTPELLRTGFRVYASGKGEAVVLRADTGVEFGLVVEVMDILNAAGVTQYGIGAIQKAG
jgi:biopolymer transport protein ExbD